MGFKGNSFMDSGYFNSPYVPLTSTPTVLNPNTFSNTSSGILTRYGKKVIPEEAIQSKPAQKYRSIDDPWEISCIE